MTPEFHGFLCIHKQIGESSYDVIRSIKKCIPEKKIGHAGTLDPFAEGLLIIAIGRGYTKQISTFQNMPKRYQFCVQLGTETDTLDSTGKITKTAEIPNLDESEIKNILQNFIGEQEQMPPAYSAKKINGKAAYKLAREGKTVELKAATITIHELELLSIEPSNKQLTLNSLVSKGTYIRTLSADIATQLKTVGHTKTLIRSHIGDYSISQALASNNLSSDKIKASLIK